MKSNYDLNPHSKFTDELRKINRGQPLKDMWIDLKYTFQPYTIKSDDDSTIAPYKKPQRDFLQIFWGIRDCAFALEFWFFALLRLLGMVTLVLPIGEAILKASRDGSFKQTLLKWPKEFVEFSWIAIQYTLRGLTQVAAYLSGLVFLKIFLRSAITWWISQPYIPKFDHVGLEFTNVLKIFKRMFKDLRDTFKPYKSNFYVKRDALQFVAGGRNLLVGIGSLIAGVLFWTIVPTVIAAIYYKAIEKTDWSEAIELAIEGANGGGLIFIASGAALTIRGLSQLATYIFVPFRMALRGLITWRKGEYTPLQNNPDIQRLASSLKVELNNTNFISSFKKNMHKLQVRFDDKITEEHKNEIVSEDKFFLKNYNFLAGLAILQAKEQRYRARGQIDASENSTTVKHKFLTVSHNDTKEDGTKIDVTVAGKSADAETKVAEIQQYLDSLIKLSPK